MDYYFLRHCWTRLANSSFGILTLMSWISFRTGYRAWGESHASPSRCNRTAPQPGKSGIQPSNNRGQTFLGQPSKRELPKGAPVPASLPPPESAAFLSPTLTTALASVSTQRFNFPVTSPPSLGSFQSPSMGIPETAPGWRDTMFAAHAANMQLRCCSGPKATDALP